MFLSERLLCWFTWSFVVKLNCTFNKNREGGSATHGRWSLNTGLWPPSVASIFKKLWGLLALFHIPVASESPSSPDIHHLLVLISTFPRATHNSTPTPASRACQTFLQRSLQHTFKRKLNSLFSSRMSVSPFHCTPFLLGISCLLIRLLPTNSDCYVLSPSQPMIPEHLSCCLLLILIFVIIIQTSLPHLQGGLYKYWNFESWFPHQQWFSPEPHCSHFPILIFQ